MLGVFSPAMFLTLLLFCLTPPFLAFGFSHIPFVDFFFPLIFPLTQLKTINPTIPNSKGEDLERNDGSAERPYFMSPELHEILSKTKKVEEDKDGMEQVDEAKQVDEVKLEEQTPLQLQQDGEVQLKDQTVLGRSEEEQPLQAKTDSEEPKEEKSEDVKVGQTEQAENTVAGDKEAGEEEKVAAEKRQEEKAESVPAAAAEAEKDTGEEKEEKKEASQEEKPPCEPHE